MEFTRCLAAFRIVSVRFASQQCTLSALIAFQQQQQQQERR